MSQITGRAELLRDGNPPPDAKRPWRHLQPRRGLAPFVFAEVDLVEHVVDHRRTESEPDDFLLAEVFHDVGVENPELCRVVLNELAKKMTARLTSLQASAQHACTQLVPGSSECPDDMGVTLLLQGAFPIIDEKFNTLTQLLIWLPHLVRVKAEEFYIPRSYLKLFNRTWNVERAIGLIEPRRQIERIGAGPPRATPPAAQRPGRNDPCPCGSQRKYKHCCAHGAST